MRSRELKPGFFKNEILASLPPHARLLFQGLWCCADRAGRLEDRPLRIKAEVFPYENVDNFEALLSQLAAKGFINRYEDSGSRYIQVVEFAKHQHPHPRETPSVIPPMKSRKKARPRTCLGSAKDMPRREKALPSRAGSSGSSGPSGPSGSSEELSSDAPCRNSTGPTPESVDNSEDSSPRSIARGRAQDPSARTAGVAWAKPQATRPGSAGSPPPRSRAPCTSRFTDEQLVVLNRLRSRIRAPDSGIRPHADAIDRVLRYYIREGAPFSVVERGIAAILEHRPPNPAPYLSRVLAVEAPNYHELEALARHQALKDEEARERSGPAVALAQEELEQLNGPLSAVLARISARAKQNGRTCPEESERQAPRAPCAPSG